MMCFVFLNISPAVVWRMGCRRQRGKPGRKLWHQSRCKTMMGAVEATRSEKLRMIWSRETRKDWKWE